MALRYISESHLPDFFFQQRSLAPHWLYLCKVDQWEWKFAYLFETTWKSWQKCCLQWNHGSYITDLASVNTICSATGNFTQRPYSEWGNDHNQMIAIKWSGISCYGRYFPYSWTNCGMKIQPMRRKIPVSVHTSWPVQDCSVSRWRPQKVDKRMVLEHTHGLFIT